MTHEEVESMLNKARRSDGTYDGSIIAQMNQQGIFFKFTKHGVYWQRDPWT